MRPDSTDRRGVLAAIDEILWRVWDPIGVNDAPEARDEYSGYAPGVLGLLCRGAEDEEVIRHLQSIEIERMGLAPDSTGRREATVSALRAAMERREEGAPPASNPEEER